MFAKSFRFVLLLVVAMAALISQVGAQSTPPKYQLEGTWQVTATFTSAKACESGNCTPIDVPPPFKVLFTFMAGRNVNEGTLIDTNEFQLTPNPVCTPDQGTWARTGERTFIATHLNFCFDANNGYIPAGTSKIRDSITMNSQNDFTARQRVEGFDADGNLVFVGDVNLIGVRLRAEAPPNQ